MGEKKIWRGPNEAESGDGVVKTHLTTLRLMGAVEITEETFLSVIIYSRDPLIKEEKQEKHQSRGGIDGFFNR